MLQGIKKVILVEGKDELSFFSSFCRHKGLTDFKCIEAQGKDKLKPLFSVALQSAGIEDLEALIVIQDADNSHKAVIQSLQAMFRNNNLPAPKDHLELVSNENDTKFGFYVMPGNADSGMLENLLLDSVNDNPIKIEADIFIGRVFDLASENEHIDAPKNIAKAKLHAYLSAQKEFKPNIGIATQKGYFDLNSHHFDSIEQFLRKA
ncbi:DUF3226 domain-containing protein [Vibrio splendidus]|uniref:DUF3226 domain-containing protein n=1 Tax=Vibrio splendidus TaxID=29497 RepID=UPI00031A0D99|nr:DUF3226 domain-containing protein [Vibrio splendidus]